MKPLNTLLLLVLLMSACMPPPLGQPTVTSDNHQIDLANSGWLLESFGEPGAESAVADGSSITLEFVENARAQGHSGCNFYRGPYSIHGGRLAFGELVSTLMACEDQTVTDQEQEYLKALGAADRFTMVDDRLVIWYENDSRVLNFARASASTPDPSPTNPLEPTAGAVPGKDDGARIEFPPGQTSAEVFAELAAGVTDSYIVHGQQGQTMSIEITSPNNDVLLSVVGEDGTPLKRYQNGPRSWKIELPSTGDYVLQAVSVGQATSYTLRVSIKPFPSQTRERVEFEPGATSATRNGTLSEGGVKEYVLTASEGQTLTVTITSEDVPLSLMITTPSGVQRIPETSPAEGAHQVSHSFTLTESGDYLVTLNKADHIASTNYTATFVIR